MKIINYVFYTIFTIALISIMFSGGIKAQSPREWCWTKSMANDPSYVFNAKTGGINWGFCKEKSTKPKMIGYKVVLHTSALPESGTK